MSTFSFKKVGNVVKYRINSQAWSATPTVNLDYDADNRTMLFVGAKGQFNIYLNSDTIIVNSTTYLPADNVLGDTIYDALLTLFINANSGSGGSGGSSNGVVPQFATVVAALAAITGTDRVAGKTVQIVDAATQNVSEYWWYGGTADVNFVQKATGGGASKTDQVITFNQPSAKTYGGANFALGGTSTSGLPVTYQFDDPTVLTQVGTSDLWIISKAGSVVITALQVGNGSFNAAPAVNRTLVVNKANQTISFTNPGDRDVVAGSFASGATASSGLAVSLASSNTAKATVSGLNIVPVEDGSVTITATQAGDGNYNAASAVVRTFAVIISEILPTLSVIGSRTYDAETTAYTSIAGAYQSANSKFYLDNLIKRLKANSLWADVQALWVPFGGATSGKKLNVKNPTDSDAAFRLVFGGGVGDDGTDKKYYFTNYNSRYADTRINASTGLDGTNFCMMTYQTLRGTNATDAACCLLGVTDGTNAVRMDATARSFSAQVGSTTINMSGATDCTGVFSDVVYGLTVKDGVMTYDVSGFRKSQAISGQTLPNLNLWMGQLNNNGTGSFTGQSQLSVTIITKNITPGKLSVLRSIIERYNVDQALWTNLGAMALGDSITQGYSATDWATTNWFSLVCANKGWTDKQNYGVTGITLQKVVGQSSGNTVPDKVTAASAWAFAGMKPYNNKFQKLFIAYGINDVFQFNNSTNPVANFNTALLALFDLVIALGWPTSKVCVLSTYFIDITTVQAGSDARQASFNSYLAAAASTYGFAYADVYTQMMNNGGTSLLNTSDHIHPYDSGHTQVATKVLAVI